MVSQHCETTASECPCRGLRAAQHQTPSMRVFGLLLLKTPSLSASSDRFREVLAFIQAGARGSVLSRVPTDASSQF